VKTLQSEIVRGLYPVGTLLPSEAALVERFDVSRQTVRSAIRTLRETGLVKSHQGLGTVVNSPGASGGYVHHVTTISDLFPVNVKTRYEPIDGRLIKLPAYARSVFDDEGTWLHIQARRQREDSNNVFNEVDIFVAGRFAGVGRVISAHAGSVYAAVEMIYGEVISEVHQEVGGFIADKTRGNAIGLKPGDAGIEVRRVFRLAADGQVALLSFNRYRIDDFTFSMTLRRLRE
jgi:DNA-binding GntR family transcriptional regulator